ncbi:unnamed protein product [Clonostachys chloroleuca]|uniref:Uncharacterized protein n=1 Tax=Clonostachys chloroleuca TaxID=1926264 RepID=A0AA35PV21_9HYPO|nr:unnamed protein product [Clonostachys chloroleuca]
MSSYGYAPPPPPPAPTVEEEVMGVVEVATILTRAPSTSPSSRLTMNTPTNITPNNPPPTTATLPRSNGLQSTAIHLHNMHMHTPTPKPRSPLQLTIPATLPSPTPLLSILSSLPTASLSLMVKHTPQPRSALHPHHIGVVKGMSLLRHTGIADLEEDIKVVEGQKTPQVSVMNMNLPLFQ